MIMKMRSSIIWLIAVITVLIAIVLWLKRAQSAETLSAASAETNISPLPIEMAARQSNSVTSVPIPSQVVPGVIISTNQPNSPVLNGKAVLLKEILQANDVNIEFYGRLEDQLGNSLGNIPINFEIRYENVNGKGIQRGQVTSDANGLFTISGYKGERLSFVPEKQVTCLSRIIMAVFIHLNGRRNKECIQTPIILL